MRQLLLALIMVLTACGQDQVQQTTTTTSSQVTVPSASPTATTVQIPLVIDDCSAPQIGFAPLCEVYELAQEWHVDRPIDPAALAEAALEGLVDFTVEGTEDPPRTIFCAVPDPAFEPVCEALVDLVEQQSAPIGAAMEAAVLSMAGTGLGQFSYYVPPELVGSFRNNGVVGGLGVLLDARDAAGSKCVRITSSCPLEIVFVLEDNAGEEAGLEAGDRILAVDEEPVDGLGFVETATRLAGDETGEVAVQVEREGRTLEFVIERATLTVPTVEIDVPRDGVGYIRIPDFEFDMPDLVREGLTELTREPIDRVVVDLRDNPGGYLQSAIDVATEFISGGVVVSTSGPTQSFEYEAGEDGLVTDIEIVVLVNAGTASAAEILANALRDRRGAVIVGEPTFGKDAVQIAFDLDNGGEFNVAIARWFSPEGATVAGTGLVPDRVMELPPTMARTDLVDAAVEGQ
jgi:C-terminal peptidase prc